MVASERIALEYCGRCSNSEGVHLLSAKSFRSDHSDHINSPARRRRMVSIPSCRLLNLISGNLRETT